jgi:restriction system protein
MALAAPLRVPTYDELMWPALKALKAMGGSGSNEEMLGKIIELENIPENLQIVIHSDQRRTRLGYILAWARTYLKWAGAE